MFENILQKIKEYLESNDLIEVVYLYERADPEGTPFATITPSANESDYNSTTENRRTYAFNIRLFVQRKGQTDSEISDRTMRELVDSVLDDLDSNFRLSGVTAKTGYTVLFLKATPSQWGYTGRENEFRVAEIKAQAVVDVDVNTI